MTVLAFAIVGHVGRDSPFPRAGKRHGKPRRWSDWPGGSGCCSARCRASGTRGIQYLFLSHNLPAICVLCTFSTPTVEACRPSDPHHPLWHLCIAIRAHQAITNAPTTQRHFLRPCYLSCRVRASKPRPAPDRDVTPADLTSNRPNGSRVRRQDPLPKGAELHPRRLLQLRLYRPRLHRQACRDRRARQPEVGPFAEPVRPETPDPDL